MAKKRRTPEQFTRKLREGEIELPKGQPIEAVCKMIGITDQAY
ncbi:MAG: hypothetical protein O7H41_16375 [Planctomycetota bacterium]|nr:hypothetical protein [Planctomycetota bacterium]